MALFRLWTCCSHPSNPQSATEKADRSMLYMLGILKQSRHFNAHHPRLRGPLGREDFHHSDRFAGNRFIGCRYRAGTRILTKRSSRSVAGTARSFIRGQAGKKSATPRAPQAGVCAYVVNHVKEAKGGLRDLHRCSGSRNTSIGVETRRSRRPTRFLEESSKHSSRREFLGRYGGHLHLLLSGRATEQ